MDLIKALPEKDINLFNAYNRDYGGGGDASVILHEWARQKESLYHAFGDQFIVSKPITIHAPQAELDARVRDFMCSSVAQRFMNDLGAAINVYQLEYYSEHRHTWRDLFSENALRENRWDKEDTLFLGKYPLNKGMRVMRFLQKLAKDYNLDDSFEKFRQKHSLIMNDSHLSGNLCLSIHPMDFITMSDNDSGWSSCMNWTEDPEGGCYRAGTIEMMNSPCVIVAYLESKTPYFPFHGNEFSWNNKKWRQLLIIDDGYAVTNKGYPYQSAELSKEVLDFYAEVMDACDWSEVEEFDYNDRYKEVNGFSFHNFYTNTMYNDFGRDCLHYAITRVDAEPQRISLNYSGRCTCMRCGYDYYPDGDYEYAVVCNDCADVYYCDHCGCRIEYGDTYTGVDGERVCCNCYEAIENDPIADEDYYTDECIYHDLFVATEEELRKAWDDGDLSKYPHLHGVREGTVAKANHGNLSKYFVGNFMIKRITLGGDQEAWWYSRIIYQVNLEDTTSEFAERFF